MFIEFVKQMAQVNKEARKNAIIEKLDEMGVAYEISDTPGIENIVVSLNPGPRRLVVMAHWDNVPCTPGANDNAAACSIVSELIREFKDTEAPIDFVFSDKEETGRALGAIAYIDSVGRENISEAINFDMCGMGETIVMPEIRRRKNGVIGALYSQDMVSKHGVQLVSHDLPITDAIGFDARNIPAVSIVASTINDLDFYNHTAGYYKFPDFAKTMHQPSDTPDTVSEEMMRKIFEYVKEAMGPLKDKNQSYDCKCKQLMIKSWHKKHI